MSYARIEQLQRKLETAGQTARSIESQLSATDLLTYRSELTRFRGILDRLEAALQSVPAIEVAMLGPSRHGKSTLLNSLACADILPTSDVKPCTASVLSLQRADEWSVKVSFIDKDRLISEWREAVDDAEDYLEQRAAQSADEPDDPRYLQNALQRFLQLFKIESEQSPYELVKQVKEATIPAETAQFLGQSPSPKSTSFEGMKKAVEKYLSTKDVFWTIVDSCEIRGPFPDWHERLRLLDLPGTNDTNVHRTAITNKLREKAQAVAIVTSESNLGYDIESWLRNSSVLSEFLESRDSDRQRLFIVRTKFDAFHPDIDDGALEDGDDEAEERLFQEAVERHKREQIDAYTGMLRDIASPLLPLGVTADERKKRDELVSRLEQLGVFFVSALAYEVFAGRSRVPKRQQRRLAEHFGDDPDRTGVPDLREYLNRIAEEYLSQNYYDDVEREIEKELDQLVHFFRREKSTLEAEMAGAGESVNSLIQNVRTQVIPWIHQEISEQVALFQSDGSGHSDGIRHRLDQTIAMSKRRFGDKTEKWSHYQWNSLRATARKGGSHTTCRGDFIDINQDICSVLVDDLILAWSSFRDYIIQQKVDSVTDEITQRLQQHLQNLAVQCENEEAMEAVGAIISQLDALTHAQRLRLLQSINAKVKQLESIRQPAYQIVQDALRATYAQIADECGTGCQQRMRNILLSGFERNIDLIRQQILSLVQDTLSELLEHCGDAMQHFGGSAVHEIEQSLEQVHQTIQLRDRRQVEGRLSIVNNVMACLPGPSAY